MDKEKLLSIYGNVGLEFENYYKYAFTYRGWLGGHSIVATFGGNGDDIYREEFEPELRIKDKDYLLNYLVIKENGAIVYEGNPNDSA